MDEIEKARLDRVYRGTHFHVHAPSPFVLKIDEPSAELAALHAQHGVSCSAFVTAWNPRSRTLPDGENEARQHELLAVLRGDGITTLPGTGVDPSGQWPGEPSVLALGLSRSRARQLGERFEQNAIVWVGPDANPALLWCVPDHEFGGPSST